MIYRSRISLNIAACFIISGLLLWSLFAVVRARANAPTGDANSINSTDSTSHPLFTELTGVDNPLSGVSAASNWEEESAPAFGDIDGDSDLDVMIGVYAGTIKMYRNDGTTSVPSYTLVTGTGNPFNGVDIGSNSAPALVDIDNDGDLDAFIGEEYGGINYFHNDSGTFTQVTGAGNPFNGVDVGYRSYSTFGDVDGDGDLDAFIGEVNGTITFYRNTGTVSTPTFSLVSGSDNPFNGVDVRYFAAPVLADLDADGDLDAVIGEEDGILNYFRNDGTSGAPSFVETTGWDNPFNFKEVGFNSTPTLGDIDGDGDLDAFSGDYLGNIHFFRNAQPEIAVSGNGKDITDDDASPSVNDYTDFSNVTLGDYLMHTFVISNIGLGDLVITGTPSVVLTGDGVSHFSVVTQPAANIHPGDTTSFQIRFTSSVTATQAATVTIANIDLDENPFDFAIRGSGVAPDMAVIGNGQIIVDGDTTPDVNDFTDFGKKKPGETITRTFTISNSGDGILRLTGSPLVWLTGTGAGYFRVVTKPSNPISATQTTTFQISFTPSVIEMQKATVVINNNDSDENPYNFAIQGKGIGYEWHIYLPILFFDPNAGG
jgi:hypothetical protein